VNCPNCVSRLALSFCPSCCSLHHVQGLQRRELSTEFLSPYRTLLSRVRRVHPNQLFCLCPNPYRKCRVSRRRGRVVFGSGCPASPWLWPWFCSSSLSSNGQSWPCPTLQGGSSLFSLVSSWSKFMSGIWRDSSWDPQMTSHSERHRRHHHHHHRTGNKEQRNIPIASPITQRLSPTQSQCATNRRQGTKFFCSHNYYILN